MKEHKPDSVSQQHERSRHARRQEQRRLRLKRTGRRRKQRREKELTPEAQAVRAQPRKCVCGQRLGHKPGPQIVNGNKHRSGGATA